LNSAFIFIHTLNDFSPLYTVKKCFAKAVVLKGFPLIRILSRTAVMCGDEKNPVFNPAWRNIASVKAHVMPFPFVPATWIIFNVSSVSNLIPRVSRVPVVWTMEWFVAVYSSLFSFALAIVWQFDWSVLSVLTAFYVPNMNNSWWISCEYFLNVY